MCGTGSISVGRDCFVGEGARVWSASRVEIGDRVLIAHGVQIFDNRTHPLDARERHQQAQALLSRGEMPDARLLDGKPIRVAEDAWIGANSIIGRGITIGAGSIIAAGSVVTRDVPPGAIVGGNPARILEERSGSQTTHYKLKAGAVCGPCLSETNPSSIWPVTRTLHAPPRKKLSDTDRARSSPP